MHNGTNKPYEKQPCLFSKPPYGRVISQRSPHRIKVRRKNVAGSDMGVSADTRARFRYYFMVADW